MRWASLSRSKLLGCYARRIEHVLRRFEQSGAAAIEGCKALLSECPTKREKAREIALWPEPPKLRASAAISAFMCPGESCLAEVFFCSLFKRLLLDLQIQGGMSSEVCPTTRSRPFLWQLGLMSQPTEA